MAGGGLTMDILYLLIPLSVMLVIPLGIAFWWALRGGQFDDFDGPAQRILMDSDEADGLPIAPAVDPGQVSRVLRP